MKRNDTLDIAKGLGMLFVIFGHLGWSFAFRATYPFHMPLFFLVAGWLLSERLEPKAYFLRRAKGLLPAYLFTAVCMIVLSGISALASGKAVPSALLRTFIRALYGSGLTANKSLFGIGQIGAIWFLLAMLEATVFVRWLIARVPKIPLQCVVVLALFAASCISAKVVWLPLSLQAGGAAALYVWLGWLAKKQRQQTALPKTPALPGIAVGLGAAAWVAAYALDRGLMVCSASFPAFWATIPLSLVIVCGVIGLAAFLSRVDCLRRALGFLGRHSLMLLSFHLMELDYAPWYLLYNVMEGAGWPELPRFAAVYLLKVLLCVGLTFAALRIPFLRRVFGEKEA